MAGSKRHPRCVHCKHPWAVHTTQPVHPCAKRVPVAWTGQGRSKRPKMGYCPCPQYEPETES